MPRPTSILPDPSTYSPDTFKPLLNKLVRTPEYFTPANLRLALDHIFTPNAVAPTQIGAFLTALHVSRLERRGESLATAAEVLRSRAISAAVEFPDDFIVDIVGTGGDGYNTFNVSTTAAVVAAGAGARVIKHGSRASTSSSGSADLLESLNCTFTPPASALNLLSDSPAAIPLPRIPFTFILAPHYHPALAFIGPHRKLLPFRTMFNVLGPLINPAKPKGMVLGIAEPELGQTFAESLRDSGVKKALVVCGEEKLDEISCAGPTNIWELSDGQITEYVVEPELDFGLERHPLNLVEGQGPTENAAVFTQMMDISGPALTEGEKQKLKPVRDFVLMNASALLVVAGVAKDFKHGVELARESIDSGKAWEAFVTFRGVGRIF